MYYGRVLARSLTGFRFEKSQPDSENGCCVWNALRKIPPIHKIKDEKWKFLPKITRIS